MDAGHELPELVTESNNHIHTIYSFSPYTPSMAALKGREVGLQVVGSVDHDSVAAAAEMRDAAAVCGMGAVTGFEVRAMHVNGPAGGGGPFPDGPRSLDESGAPDPAWFEPIPEAERMSRDELRRVANLYFAGLEKNDGKGDYPFADDCVRIENGELVTAESKARDGGTQRDTRTPYRLDLKAMSAKEQFESGFFAFVDRIRERRFPLVDEERGIVFTFAFFEHSGTVRDYTLADGTPTSAGLDRPFTWMIAEAFRIERGLFTRIEALMTAVPYGHRSGWPAD